MVKKIPRYVCSFWHNPRTWQTDGQTDRRKNRQTPHDSIDRACNASQHVPVYLLQFPSYSNHNCKKSPFYVPRPSFFVCPGDAPVAITQNDAWMKRQFSARQIPRSMYLSIFSSFRVIRCLSQCVSPKIAIFTTFLFPLGTPLGNHAKCCMNGKRIRCLQIVSHHVPIYLQHFPSYSNRKCKKSPFSRTAAHIFVSPGDALRLWRKILHRWKDNSMLAKRLAACTYLSSIVSELYDA